MEDKIISAGMDEISPLLIELINSGKDVSLTVTGNSMAPTIIGGRDSVVLTKPVRLRKYDIPLYRRKSGQYVLHRIIKIRGDVMYVAGDNQTRIEYPVYTNQAIAVVKGIYRKGKYISATDPLYRLYSALWALVLPWRRQIFELYAFLKGTKRGKK